MLLSVGYDNELENVLITSVMMSTAVLYRSETSDRSMFSGVWHSPATISAASTKYGNLPRTNDVQLTG